jgi:hypothetical protein
MGERTMRELTAEALKMYLNYPDGHACRALAEALVEARERAEKYFVKARVYGAIAAGFRRAIEDGTPRDLILAWRYSSDGGVPRADLDAFERLLKAEEQLAKARADLERDQVIFGQIAARLHAAVADEDAI